jgi:ribosomal protein S18 acetylase RimI-like enzyme
MARDAKAHGIRDAAPEDAPQVAAIDTVAAVGDSERRASIECWIANGSMRVAVAADEIVGYCVTERAFFGHWFVVMLMVAEGARGQGIGAELLLDAQRQRDTAKLFTSTNLSNQPMQRLLGRLGWRSVGIVYGLDEGDPELFYLAPRARPASAEVALVQGLQAGEHLRQVAFMHHAEPLGCPGDGDVEVVQPAG